MGGNTLPFPRGAVYTSPPEGIVGKLFYDETYDQELRVVKAAASIAGGKKIVKWTTRASHTVQRCSVEADGVLACGITDPQLPSTALTTGRAFYVVTRGLVTGISVAAGPVGANTPAKPAASGYITKAAAIGSASGLTDDVLAARGQMYAVGVTLVSAGGAAAAAVAMCCRFWSA